MPIRTGEEVYRPFIPAPLPPTPPLELAGEIIDLLGRADRAIGGLDGIRHVLPDVGLFLYFYVRKEAVLSSQIEGTQSSLSELLLFEAGKEEDVEFDDVVEVSNYVAAMNHGLKRVRENEFPLSLRLMREIHGILLRTGRGSEGGRGEFRRSQNWVGGARPGNAAYVPPPPEEVMSCMGALEGFIHEKRPGMPPLVKAALAHVQFETIHPFLDGNGRVGRLLVTFILCWENVLREPLLYLSLFLKERRAEYYDLLQRVRTDGDWEAWISFFLVGVAETAERAISSCESLTKLVELDRAAVEGLGRRANTGLRVLDLLRNRPILTVSRAAEELGLSEPTVSSRMADLAKLGIVSETSGRRWKRRFAYRKYLDILAEGTEPIPVP